MARGLFITGTNTEVGKTYVAAAIVRALVAAGKHVGVYKPVASGCIAKGDQLVSEDAHVLWQAAGQPGLLADVCPQIFEAPLVPHLAARAEGKEIDMEALRAGLDAWLEYEIVIVEGAGGLMSPLGEDEYVADLACDFGFPIVVIAANMLGVINQTLQTLIAATTFRDGLQVAGVVLNDISADDSADISRRSNFEELEHRCIPPLLAHVRRNDASSLGRDEFLKYLRETPPAPGHDRVYYAGLPEHEESIDRHERGIPLHKEVVDWFDLACQN